VTAKSRLHYAIESLRAAIAADERGAVGTLREGNTAGTPNTTSNAAWPTTT
jgi:hypothetical protein